MRSRITIIAMTAVLAAATTNAALLNVDFDTETVGNTPAGTTVLAGGATMEVIDSLANKAGTGNGLLLEDNSSSAYVRLGYNFTSGTGESAVRIDMDLALLTADTSHIDIGVFQKGVNSGSYHDRYAFVRVSGNGDLKAVGDKNDTKEGFLALDTPHTLTMYLNDGATAITDYQPGWDLAADSVAYWADGSHWLTTALRTDTANNINPTATTSELGMLGFITNSSGMTKIAVDNINVTAIPEPATTGMLGLGALITLLYRRVRPREV